MANIVDFSLELIGGQEALDRLVEMILRDVEEAPDEEMYFSPKTDAWAIPEASEHGFWLKELCQYTGRSVLNERSTDGELRISGASKCAPPLLFAECILKVFPGVHYVSCKSTEENGPYEHWESVGSRSLVCRCEQLTNIQEDRIERLVIDGVQIIPAGADGERK